MSQSQLKEYRLALKVICAEIKIGEFAVLIGKSCRQAQRIVKSVREMDFIGVLHGNYGKTSSDGFSLEDVRYATAQAFQIVVYQERRAENKRVLSHIAEIKYDSGELKLNVL